MNFKLKTSKETMKIFIDLGNSLHLQPYILSKIAIALSLKCKEILGEKDFLTDNEGIELNRQTITGEYDELFKALIISNNNEKLDTDVDKLLNDFVDFQEQSVERLKKFL